ncbi:alpha/beta hydrolase [Candidatus Marimicrobium litorale]|uniref:Alpha/beta hydrolase n=1 Tax=Candidatus Marimicrobium litorale TaxID=2518991 RepID=A0ABT3T0U3_9GAMM|nr:alpha/beta hydrolase [Candidatus Marimicrobium litorale]
MSQQYDIHPDFRKFPRITIGFTAPVMFLVNLLMRLQCFFAVRKLSLKVNNYRCQRKDGSHLDILTMTPPVIDKLAPALIYYHGGGFGISYSSLHLQNCERYAIEAGCIVVFVDYRLGPKHPFPFGFDDSYDALQWTIDRAEELGIDPSRIALGGDSAGGALAAGVAQKARDTGLTSPCAQLLIYPVMDNSCSTPSATQFEDVPLWNAKSNRNMWQMYLARYPQGEAPLYAAPGFGDVQSLPPSYVETAEFDPLRDEGKDYASKLTSAGIDVVRNDTLQTIHGYDGMAKNMIAKESMLQRIAFLKDNFGH